MDPKQPNEIVRKSVAVVAEENTEARTFTFVASDDSVDRYGDTIDAKGWDLKNFEANPVILLNHKANELPVGRAVRTWVDGNKLKTEIKFAPADVNPVGPMVEAAVRKGFINALSVGFKPKESTDAEDRQGDGWFPPKNYKAQELLEISVVTVPANPNALLEARSAGEDLTWIRETALRTLEALDGPGRWVPRSVAHAVRAFEPVAAPALKAVPPPAPVAEEVEITPEEIAEMVRSARAERIADEARRAAELKTKRTGKL